MSNSNDGIAYTVKVLCLAEGIWSSFRDRQRQWHKSRKSPDVMTILSAIVECLKSKKSTEFAFVLLFWLVAFLLGYRSISVACIETTLKRRRHAFVHSSILIHERFGLNRNSLGRRHKYTAATLSYGRAQISIYLDGWVGDDGLVFFHIELKAPAQY